MNRLLFLYRFEFPPHENPPKRKDEFEENLKAYLALKGLGFGMSALGGARLTMGTVDRENGDVSIEDRANFAAWAKSQPIKAIAGLGEIEADHDDLELFREIHEWNFRIDNLSQTDRADAAKHKQKIDAMLADAIAQREANNDE